MSLRNRLDQRQYFESDEAKNDQPLYTPITGRKAIGMAETATVRTRDRVAASNGMTAIEQELAEIEAAEQAKRDAQEQARYETKRPLIEALAKEQNRHDQLVLMNSTGPNVEWDQFRPSIDAAFARVNVLLDRLGINKTKYWAERNALLEVEIAEKRQQDLELTAQGDGMDAANAKVALELQQAQRAGAAANAAAKQFASEHPEYQVTQENAQELTDFMQRNQLPFDDPNSYLQAFESLVYAGAIEVDQQTLNRIGEPIYAERVAQGLEAPVPARGWMGLAERSFVQADPTDSVIATRPDGTTYEREMTSEEWRKAMRLPKDRT
jgi:hypothetical protein